MRSRTLHRIMASPLELTHINRSYNLRMRDIYFEKANECFVQFRQNAKKDLKERDFSSLNNFCGVLDITYDFARQAVSGVSQKQEKKEEPVPQPSFMQEEVLFIHLLEELQSSGRFLTTLFKNIYELNSYRLEIDSLPKSTGIQEGYISRIIQFINENQKAEEEEVDRIIELITNRIELANRIHVITKK